MAVVIIPESVELLIQRASDAFLQDFRYAEAIAKQASTLTARREARRTGTVGDLSSKAA